MALPILAALAWTRLEDQSPSGGGQAGQVYTLLQLGFLHQRASEALAMCPAPGSLPRVLEEYDPGRLAEMIEAARACKARRP